MAFRLLVDTVQSRLKDDGVSTLVGASDWDYSLGNNTYQDGVTGTVMLLMNCLYPDWLTSNTGMFVKLAPSDFTLAPVSSDPNWTFPTVNSDNAPWYKYANNVGGAGGIMTSSVAANQAMVFECSRNQTTSGRIAIGECGWSSGGTSAAGVALRFWSDNSADVYKNGTNLGNFSLSGQQSAYGQTDGQVAGDQSQAYNLYMLIPCRERELLVISSTGAGFSLIFADIPEGTVGAVITPAEPFWFASAPGVDSQIRCAVMQFATTGNAIGKLSYFRYDPGAHPPGGFQTYVDCNIPTGAGVSMQVSDGINPSIPFVSNANGVCLNVSLTGTGLVTPFIYGTRGYTKPQLASTWGASPLDVTDYILDLSYEVSDSVSGVRASVTLRDPKAIIAAGVAQDPTNQPGALIDAITNRSWQLYDTDGTIFLEGINERPKLIEKARIQTVAESNPGDMTYGDQTNTNRLESVSFEIRDAWYLAENYVFKDVIPLDGLSVTDAYTLITSMIGLDTPHVSVALSTIFISQAGNPTGRFNLQIEPGDKGSDWMDRIAKTYCANYSHGITPSGGGLSTPYLLSAADMPSAVAVDLYDSVASALADGVMTPTYRDLFRRSDIQMLEAEANDCYVEGYDYRTQRPILVHKADNLNMDPTIIPALRTPAWRGQRISYAWIDPTLGDIDVCTYAMGLIYDRITIARSMPEIECDFYGILPRGSLIQMHYLTGGGVRSPISGIVQNPVIGRVKSISARFQSLTNGAATEWRPTKYVLQIGDDVSDTNTHRPALAQIGSEWTMRAISKYVQFGNANYKQAWTRPLLLQAEL